MSVLLLLRQIRASTYLPELKIPDPVNLVEALLDKAQAKGSKDIFVNILTDTGLVQRFLTDWAGPNAVVKSIGLRLGVPWYAYDTVTFTGEVTAVDGDLVTTKVVGSNSLGDHVIATATLTMGN